jgi:hypothetical protein
MNGNISKEGITLDLEAMKRAGVGGFQIFQAGRNVPKGPVDYGSPEHIQLIEFAISEANRLGLEFAMHNCPGWSSSGGPWITPELSMQVLIYSETPVIGGQQVTVSLPQPQGKQNYYKDAMVIAFPTPKSDARLADWSVKASYQPPRRIPGSAVPVEPPPPPPDSFIDPAKVLDLSGDMNSQGKLTWNAPVGDWTVVRFGHTTTGAVNSPAPDGGQGLECDKFNTEAIDFHFQHFFGDLFASLKPLLDKGVVGATIDSYERGLQNWTSAFPQDFQQRCGYKILNYMPAMMGHVVGNSDISERFLWDIRKVQAELMDENYYGRFAELCHKHGMKSYIEPYDPGNFDEMGAGRHADVPMGEFWFNQANQHSIKLAASIAHIYGHPVVGAESYTSRSRWTEYPYSLKALGDFMYCQGLNRFLFHRYAMQPHPTAVPGTTLGPYGSQFERTNTWYPQATSWLEYVRRCQFMLQQGRFVADVLYFFGEDSPATVVERAHLQPVMPDGYDYDLIDVDAIMSRIRIVNGRIVLPDGTSYGIFVLSEKKTFSLPLLERVRDLVRQGMVLVLGGQRPQGVPGLTDYPRSDAALSRVADELWDPSKGTDTERTFGLGRIFQGMSLQQVLDKLKIKPDFEPTTNNPEIEIHYIHRRIHEADVYFVANRDELKAADLVCTFNVKGKRPELWDAATGRTSPAAVYTLADGRVRMPLRLDPSGSVFVVFRAPASTRMLESIAKDDNILLTVAPMSSKPRMAVPLHISSGGLELAHPMPTPMDPPAIEQAAGPRGELLAWQNGDYSLRDNSGKTSLRHISAIEDTIEINGPWQIAFPPNLGAPAAATFAKLISWPDSSDTGIKYFSGTATYTNRFHIAVDAKAQGRRLYLDLGKVHVLAEVKINGKDLGVLWKVPFRIDITGSVHAGDNDLEIKVTNLWPNRMIGDEYLPVENQYSTTSNAGAILKLPDWFLQGKPKPPGGRITFATWKHWDADSPLIESGLIGPVRIRTALPISAG